MTTSDIHWINLHGMELGFSFEPVKFIAIKDTGIADKFYNYKGYEKNVAMLGYTIDGYRCFAFESEHDAFMMYLKFK